TPPTAEEKAKLRAWALAWLQAELMQRAQWLQARDGKALAALVHGLSAWQREPALAVVRDARAMTGLPAMEQTAWQQFWAEVGQLQKQVAANVRTLPLKGTLTPQEREQVHEVKLQAGQVCLLDLESAQFDTYLEVQDRMGKTLDRNDDVSAENLNSRLVFTAPGDGIHCLVASSIVQGGTGPYTLTVRSFSELKQ